MLLSSDAGIITLLPDLPYAWRSGAVRGLRAPGGFTIDLAWHDGALAKATVHSHSGNRCRVRYEDRIVEFPTRAGHSYGIAPELAATR